MAKTVKVQEYNGPDNFPCIQCGRYTAKTKYVLNGTGFFGVTEAQWFCSSGCACSYARDHGWTVK